MIGIVLAAHGRLAEEFQRAAEHMLGPQEQFAVVCIGAEDDLEQSCRDILAAVAQAECGGGVIILTDIYGSTPSNLAISARREGAVEVIAGMNLPMLIALLSHRETENLAQALEVAQTAGRKYIYAPGLDLNGAS